jgi:hypothetical protein
MQYKKFVVLVFCGLFLNCHISNGQTLPPAQYSAGGVSFVGPISTTNIPGPNPESASLVTSYFSNSVVITLFAMAGGGPSVSGSGSVSPWLYSAAESIGGEIGGTVTYYMQLNGANGTIRNVIPVSVKGSVSVQAAGLNSSDIGYAGIIETAQADVKIGSGTVPGENLVYSDDAYMFDYPDTATIVSNGPYAGTFNMTVGYPYYIVVDAGISLDGTYPDEVSASATADPIITLDPSYVAAGYSIAYSSGITIPPPLSIIPGDGFVTLLWPTNAAGFNLYQTADLSGSAWTQVAATLTTTGTVYSVTQPMATGNKFFRLSNP